MSFEDEIKSLPDNLKGFVSGDIEIGDFHIPKIIPVGAVVAAVAYLGYRASKNKSSSGDIQSSATSPSATPDEQSDGLLDAISGGFNPKDSIDYTPFDQVKTDDSSGIGLGYEATLPTIDYGSVGGYGGSYGSDIPYMTSSDYASGGDGNNGVSYLSDSSGQSYAVPSVTANSINSGVGKVQLVNNGLGVANAAINPSRAAASNLSSAIVNALKPAVSKVGNVSVPVSSVIQPNILQSALSAATNKPTNAGGNVGVPISGLGKAVSGLGSVGSSLLSGASSAVKNVGGVLGLGTAPVKGGVSVGGGGSGNGLAVGLGGLAGLGSILKPAVSKPQVVTSVKPPQVTIVKPKAIVNKVIGTSTTGKAPVVTNNTKVTGARVVLR